MPPREHTRARASCFCRFICAIKRQFFRVFFARRFRLKIVRIALIRTRPCSPFLSIAADFSKLKIRVTMDRVELWGKSWWIVLGWVTYCMWVGSRNLDPFPLYILSIYLYVQCKDEHTDTKQKRQTAFAAITKRCMLFRTQTDYYIQWSWAFLGRIIMHFQYDSVIVLITFVLNSFMRNQFTSMSKNCRILFVEWSHFLSFQVKTILLWFCVSCSRT